MGETILLKGTYLWDGVGEELSKKGTIRIQDDRITAIDYWDKLSNQHHDQLWDFTGMTIMPGLIDAHTHLSMDPTLKNYLDHMKDPLEDLKTRAIHMMKKDLYAGVTTCRCLGDKEFLDIDLRHAVESDDLTGPRLQVATRGIRSPHGHGFVGYPFAGPEAIKSAILENIEAGADFIKIYITGTLKGAEEIHSYLTYEEISIAIRTAHEAGLRVASHCVGGIGLDWALDLGLDTLEHAYHIEPEQVQRLSRCSTFLVLTPSPILTDQRVLNLPAPLIPGHFEERSIIFNNMAACIASGMPFAVGTDGMHGELVSEVGYLVDMGATPHQALQAATINGAKACKLEAETGSLEVGKCADILVVEGNPLNDVSALRKVGAVIKAGKLVKS